MLKKRERLTRAAFATHFKVGRRYHSPTLQLIYVPTPDFHGAAVVGKKVYRKAVDRNRLRRQLYSRLYQLRQHDGFTGVYILIAKPAAATLSSAGLTAAVTELIGRSQKAR